ncbi:MAG: VOC family protein [Bacteroidales bacterium]|jgi:catechol 2,3-dioxygenase-like lactoylglutathione lyase family enzyme|nr:VOC family protein [Bacteroidales bacterium]MDD2571373.1 VOC family protein [Bacteroidales bacterium]MDD3384904.1 VOC family protein [Bacteroidales bacterium]MDD3810979.1 VOC family protein [Bacteroidales bacterium]MDD3872390.1 VOC family protein [Bacteroidales bacterium]
MKLKHIGLSVNDSEEIENFYEDILGFSLQRKFLMAADITSTFFGIARDIDVYFMEKDHIGLEIFLYPEKGKKVFPHQCLEFAGCHDAYTKAQERNYKTEVKINPGRSNTFFIWDKSGNMFELKEAM